MNFIPVPSYYFKMTPCKKKAAASLVCLKSIFIRGVEYRELKVSRQSGGPRTCSTARLLSKGHCHRHLHSKCNLFQGKHGKHAYGNNSWMMEPAEETDRGWNIQPALTDVQSASAYINIGGTSDSSSHTSGGGKQTKQRDPLSGLLGQSTMRRRRLPVR